MWFSFIEETDVDGPDKRSAPLPATVTDDSGDPEGAFYIHPPPEGAVGTVYVVWRGSEPGLYWTW